MYYPIKRKFRGYFYLLGNIHLSSTVSVILVIVLALFCWNQDVGLCQEWPEIKTRLLSDKCFSVIESDSGTRKRHCPHHDLNGKLDEEQLIYVLGTLDREIWFDPKNKMVAQKHLEKHYNRFINKAMQNGLKSPVNINQAKLTELVMLPLIGPVLAVKIVEYRNRHNMYMTIQDIKKVEGIGQGTFNAIRHYISTD